MDTKLAVSKTYLHYKQLGGGRPSLSKIALKHKVNQWFVLKVEGELDVSVKVVGHLIRFQRDVRNVSVLYVCPQLASRSLETRKFA